ncbi:MAG: DUF4091 domain-containing protein [Planctomycetota bacterium]|nr:DUF4091 domain-containing protein [Planctomycetota bacterium]
MLTLFYLLYGYITCRDDHLLKINKSGDKWRYDFTGLEGVLAHMVEKGLKFNIFSPSFWSEPVLNFVLTPLLAEFAYLGDEIFTSDEFERRVRELLESYVVYLEEKGWLGHAFCYIWDEPQSRSSLDHCERMAEMVKEVCSSMRRFLACGYATPRDVKGIDIWSPHLGEYLRDEEQYRAAMEAGEEVWWYVSNSPNYPYPTLFVDFPAVAHRIIWWMTWKYGLGGFVYWNVSAWHYAGTENFHEDPQKRWPNAPWKTTMFADAEGNARKGTANGAGQLIYPWPDGPTPSLRLAVIRDGLQDYEYLRLLREGIDQLKLKTGGEDLSGLIAESEETLKVVDDLVQSTSDFEMDPARILDARDRISAQIEKIPSVS